MMNREMKRVLLCTLAALTALLPLGGCGEGEPLEEDERTSGIHAPVEETENVEPEDVEPEETPGASEGETPPPPAGTAEPLTLIDALYGAGEFDAPAPVSYGTMDPTFSQDERIRRIRDWYYETEGNSDQYEQRAYDGSFTSFWDAGKLVKIEVTEAIDPAVPDGTKYYYYYRDGNPYFVYVEDSAHELRLYYWNGEMIRWIETDHVTHDSGNSSYAQYFDTAWRLYQVVTELG